jgi:hypothetical protein
MVVCMVCMVHGHAMRNAKMRESKAEKFGSEQSCDIADISGSTGKPFNITKAMQIKKAYPASAATCIESYYWKLNIPTPKGYQSATKPPASYSPKPYEKRSVPEPYILRGSQESVDGRVEKRQGKGCKDYAFFYARGSLEPASKNNMGISLGGNLQSGLDKAMPGKWHTQGIDYPAAMSDNYCVGLPGGYNCMNQMTKYAKNCPNTKLALAGFSQGGMVVRNCAAFVDDSVRKNIVVSLNE